MRGLIFAFSMFLAVPSYASEMNAIIAAFEGQIKHNKEQCNLAFGDLPICDCLSKNATPGIDIATYVKLVSGDIEILKNDFKYESMSKQNQQQFDSMVTLSKRTQSTCVNNE